RTMARGRVPAPIRGASAEGNCPMQVKPARLLVTLAANVGFLLTGDTSLAAAALPPSPIKIIVPKPAGGTADILPRIIADALGCVWKQPVVVENRTGAAGNI